MVIRIRTRWFGIRIVHNAVNPVDVGIDPRIEGKVTDSSICAITSRGNAGDKELAVDFEECRASRITRSRIALGIVCLLYTSDAADE